MKKTFELCYKFPQENFSFQIVLQGKKLKVIFIDNIIHNYKWLRIFAPQIDETFLFVVTLGCYYSDALVQNCNEMFEYLKLKKSNFFILYNTKEDVERFSKHGFRGTICNNNCWLDENCYKVIDCEKKYDAIMVSRAIAIKRHYLAREVSNLALVTNGINVDEPNGEIELPPHVYNNLYHLPTPKVNELISESRCGLILSPEEGACYASSEYLLCGIPVVSTYSKGGRDAWYNDYNSIIVEDDEKEVSLAVEHFKLVSKDPHKIRNDHIQLAQQYREKLFNILQKAVDIRYKNCDFRQHFSYKFKNKLHDYTQEWDFDKVFKTYDYVDF
jgi:glycosyltransferase involved in cell wall biosynthesis